ncbi:MAG: 50S ribosomal protein L21 [Alphaproteobacteria bacterium]|uniref:Large ribosomal subunit protein bL21 n=1 Tax=PS1 clade bacterium TaxID=2175152 RepID=A0A368DS13_9PROT|nr:50S ribosomal protein L21 [Rhodobiaceae bacterium]OUT74796.1 MAG: 50S ribosomal protein L21 [Rhizobiales bacterium TMED25]RCL74622.1 MAG: 50S ribosomal protein L21 [PS1 clade bacterium]|tara:strand:- start:1228 stop:1716 length:489 start_codon:yes stop_codon:yes gene_type:complete
MTAVIRTGGKQYSVNKDDIIIVEKLPEEQGKTITFSDVLMITEGEKTLVGTPYVENASVTAQVIEQSRSKKIIVFKKKRRQNYRRTMGHRQLQTKLKIIDIATSSSKKVVKKVVTEEEKKVVKKVTKKVEADSVKKPVKKAAAPKKATTKKVSASTKDVKKK